MEDEIDIRRRQVYAHIKAALLKALKEAFENGESEAMLAFKCGLSQAQINRLIHGKRGKALSIRSILGIAIGLNIDLLWLFSAEPTDKKEEIKALLAKIGKMIANE